MEATRAMNMVVEIADRHNHAPAKLPNDPGPNAEPRQTVAVDGQNIPPSGKPEAEGTLSREELNAAVSRLSDYVQTIQRTLDFSVDEETGRTIITVMDAKTEQVIREIPPDEVRKMLNHITASSKDGGQDPQGLFVQEKV